jgi:uncharacterized SAM-binding protein YcdF (DUF218 family)
VRDHVDAQVRQCRRVVLVVALLLLPLAWVRTFLLPVSAATSSVDLVLVLGPTYTDSRLAIAQDVVRRRPVSVLMVSVDDPAANCRGMSAPGAAELRCFRPEPFTTRGEARAAGRLMQEQSLRSVLVVAPPDQLARAEFLMRRCTSAPVLGVVSPSGSLADVLRMAPYQMAAMVQAYSWTTC